MNIAPTRLRREILGCDLLLVCSIALSLFFLTRLCSFKSSLAYLVFFLAASIRLIRVFRPFAVLVVVLFAISLIQLDNHPFVTVWYYASINRIHLFFAASCLGYLLASYRLAELLEQQRQNKDILEIESTTTWREFPFWIVILPIWSWAGFYWIAFGYSEDTPSSVLADAGVFAHLFALLWTTSLFIVLIKFALEYDRILFSGPLRLRCFLNDLFWKEERRELHALSRKLSSGKQRDQ